MKSEEVVKLAYLVIANFPNMQERDIKNTVQLWQRTLSDMPYELAEKALIKTLFTAKFFPTIAEIRDAAKKLVNSQNNILSPEEAWGEVRRSYTHFGDFMYSGKLPQYSNESIGKTVEIMGYRNLCVSENEVADRAHFFRIYESLLNKQKEEQINQEVKALCDDLAERKQLTK